MNDDPTLNEVEKEAERRRQEASNKAKGPLPDHIRSIQNTSVTYIVDPKILPFGLVDGVKLRTTLSAKFRLRFKLPQYDPRALVALGIDANKMTEETLFSFLLNNQSPQLLFENGRYPTGPNTFVPIDMVAFTSENVIAKVSGVTAVAEVVAADAFNAFQEATGGLQKWDNPEIQEKVNMVSFSTATKVDVGRDVKAFLNPGMVEYLDKNVHTGARLGAKATSYSRYDDFKPSPSIVASWSFDELYFKLHSFNNTTGLAESSVVHLDTKTKDERGRGIVEISSSLPFDEHVRMVTEIVKMLKKACHKETEN